MDSALLDDGDENNITSTVYYTPSNHDGPPDPQQSFIFGPGDYRGSRARTLNGGGGATLDGGANSREVPSIITSTQTNWALVIRHWALSTLFLPLYAVALVTYSWKNTPRQLGKIHGTLIIMASFVFYALLWAMFALYIKYPELRHFFPARQGWFVFFVYVMCCFAESMLKNTATINVPMERAAEVKVVTRAGQVDIDAFLDRILDLAAPTPSKVRVSQLFSVLTAIAYGGAVLALHLYSYFSGGGGGGASSTDPTGPYSLAVVVVYMTISTCIQFVLGLVILYPLGQVALRLSVRDKVARTFCEHVPQRGQQHEYAFGLDTIENIRAWQTARDTLLRRYAFPTLYVDVVVSAAFTLWVPLVLVGAMDFLFRASVSPLALNAAMLAVLILVYLLVCVIMASQAQERLSNTEPLRWQEYQFLVQVGDSSSIARVLRRLAQLIDLGRDQAVVFQVWGFPLNRKMSTFLGGVLFTVASSVIVRISGSGVSQ